MNSLQQPKLKKSHIGIIVVSLFVVLPLIIYLSLALSKKDDDGKPDWKLCQTLRKNADSCSPNSNTNTINYNTLYKITGLSQSSNNSGTVVGWDDSVNVFLNKTDEPYDITTQDEIQVGDSVVFQVPGKDGKNQGCTTNCGQYGCRVLVFAPGEDAKWGHGGDYDTDENKCKSIHTLNKIVLNKGEKDNEYIIKDGKGVEHTITISSV